MDSHVCHIMCSDEDRTAVEDLIVYINTRKELVVRLDHTDYENARRNRSTLAVVPDDDTSRLAERLDVTLSELPDCIGECMDRWTHIVNPGFRHVRNCFKEITECLLDEACRFRIHTHSRRLS